MRVWGGAQLQGAGLGEARLQGAILVQANLQGADLGRAQLQGADLREAQLRGASLRSAELYGAIIEGSNTTLVDLHAARWMPLEQERLAQICKMLGETIADTRWREEALKRIERAGNAGLPPPLPGSCLIDPEVTPGWKCHRQWVAEEVDAFRSELFPVLEKLACGSSAIARSLILQIAPGDATIGRFGLAVRGLESADQLLAFHDATTGRFGLAGRFAALLDKQECGGLSSLLEADKNEIRSTAGSEEMMRGQEAGKPAGEVPPSPIPPPAIAPETP